MHQSLIRCSVLSVISVYEAYYYPKLVAAHMLVDSPSFSLYICNFGFANRCKLQLLVLVDCHLVMFGPHLRGLIVVALPETDTIN